MSYFIATCTGESISTVTLATGTGEATRGVGTVSIRVTGSSTIGTFINICKIANELLSQRAQGQVNYLPTQLTPFPL